MGMAMGSSTSATAVQSSSVNNWQQRQQNFKALTSALQSGDLSAAQQAYSALTGGNSTNSNSNSPMAQIGKALQNGDLSGAQQALQAMQSKHHHHGGGAQATSAPSTPSSLPVSTSSTIGTVINTIA